MARVFPAFTLGLGLLCLAVADARLNGQTRVDQQRDGNVVISGTLEAVPGYPRVHVRLRNANGTLTAERQLLGGRLEGMAGLKEMLNQGMNQPSQPSNPADGAHDAKGRGKASGNGTANATGEAGHKNHAQPRERSFTAFLDTGASAYVIAKSTAERFGIEAKPKAVYHEAGLQGQTPMGVSKPYTIALAGASGSASGLVGQLTGQGNQANQAAMAFRVVGRNQRLQLIPKPPSNPLVKMSMGAINVIGTPAIRQLVVEITPPSSSGLGGGDGGASGLLSSLQGGAGSQATHANPKNPTTTQPDTNTGEVETTDDQSTQDHGQAADQGAARAAKQQQLDVNDLQNLNLNDLQNLDTQDLMKNLGQLATGPSVHLHKAGYRPKHVDLRVPLKYVDYNRSDNPKDRGPKPALDKNPVVRNVKTKLANKHFTGDWLLDTGAPASLISINQAEALGLYEDGQPTRPADYQIPLGGVSGKMSQTPGFIIDRLRITADQGKTITYRNAHVLVHDVKVKLDNAKTVTLDGVLGTNLLLPTVAGLGQGLGLPSQSAAGPYKRIYIDGPRGQLLLQLADQPGGPSAQ